MNLNTFSNRNGHRLVDNTIQVDSMNDALRVSLWNTLVKQVWKNSNSHYCFEGDSFDTLFEYWWVEILKRTVDTRPLTISPMSSTIREHFFSSEWFDVYDFIEFVVTFVKDEAHDLTTQINLAMEREHSRYVSIALRQLGEGK